MINTNDTARLLIEALPYIRRFTGKTIVVKVGGLPMTDPDRARSLAKDVLLLHSVGIRPVFLSGVGAISVVRMAYDVPAGRLTFFRKRRMRPIGLPMRPGELNRYRSARDSSAGLTSRM